MPLESSLGGLSSPISGTFTSLVLANSPYWWYRCNDLSGPTLLDSSGNGRNGSFINALTFQNPGFSTDGNHSIQSATTGAGSLVLATGGPGINSNSAFTIGFWWKPNPDSVTPGAVVFPVSARGGANGWVLQIQYSDYAINVSPFNSYTAPNWETPITTVNIAAGVAHFHWLTYDGSGNWNSYLDGGTVAVVSVTGAPLVVPTPTQSFMAGGNQSSGTNGASGYWQDIMTFGSVLSASTRQAIYTAATT